MRRGAGEEQPWQSCCLELLMGIERSGKPHQAAFILSPLFNARYNKTTILDHFKGSNLHCITAAIILSEKDKTCNLVLSAL